MIQPNELRIGNWVTIVSAEHWLGQVTHISSDGFVSNTKCQNISIKHCHPVPLTPEILDKCGFKRSANGVRVLFVGKYGFTMYSGGCYLQQDDYAGMMDIDQVEHLHQLQNLYFALTGDELKVTL